MIVTLITFFGTKEKPCRKEDLPTGGFFETFLAVFKNKPYVFLLITYALHITGITFITTILAYYTENVLNRSDINSFASALLKLPLDITTVAMLLLLLTAMLCIPVSVLVSKYLGKKRTYQICFVVLGIACAVLYLFGHRMSVDAFFLVMIFAGIGVGFSYVAPFAMVPDAISAGAPESERRNEGAYYGIWTFISKSGTAIALFVAGIILQTGGYISQSGETIATQPDSVVNAIRIIIGPIPVVVLAFAIVVVQFYPLDKQGSSKGTDL